MTENLGLQNQQTTGEDRVRMVARQISEPRTANWIASEADWSHGPTKRVLERLVDDGILHRDDTGAHMTYFPDYRRQALTEAIRLRDSDHSVEDLTDMNARIRGWKDEFDVEAVQAIPTYTEDIREIVVSGIPVYKTSDFDTVENLLLEDWTADE